MAVHKWWMVIQYYNFKTFAISSDQARFGLSTTDMKRRMTKKKMNVLWSAVAYYLSVLEDPDTYEYQESISEKELLEAWRTLREKFSHIDF